MEFQGNPNGTTLHLITIGDVDIEKLDIFSNETIKEKVKSITVSNIPSDAELKTEIARLMGLDDEERPGLIMVDRGDDEAEVVAATPRNHRRIMMLEAMILTNPLHGMEDMMASIKITAGNISKKARAEKQHHRWQQHAHKRKI